ncbi:MAG: metallophosphoesterase family protein [Polyangiales bacterium]
MSPPSDKPFSRPKPASEPMGFLSDVHGNLRALDAVIDELKRRGVRDLFVAGDLLLGGDEPLAVWRKLQSVGARCVCGPSDLALARVDPRALKPQDDTERDKVRTFIETQRALGELIQKQLGQLPRELRVPMIDGAELLMVHGSPRDPFEPIGHELDDEELRVVLEDDPADVVVCGGTHVPYARRLDEVQLINVGSVGSAPEGRFAHYAIVFPSLSGSHFDQGYVEY